MSKGLRILVLCGIFLLLNPLTTAVVHSTVNVVQVPERIAYFISSSDQYGLWLFNPQVNTKELLNSEITDDYQFSPDGHYLAFLANNHDRGKSFSNTISLWIKDLLSGHEQVVTSDFDTDSNVDAKFSWLATGELAVEQITEYGEKRVTIYSPGTEKLWQVPKEYQYLSYSNDRVLLRNRAEDRLYFYHLLSQQVEALPIHGLIINASISPKGDYLCYQTFKEIILINLKKAERVYIDVGELSGVDFGWSPDQGFLIYQSRKLTGDEEYYQLTVFNIQTSMKEFEISSKEKITYSWSSDEKQMVFSYYREGWNIMVWFPEQYSTRTIQNGLLHQPKPMYQKQTHEFIYLAYADSIPRVYSYNVDDNLLKLIHSGSPQMTWTRLDWVQIHTYKVKRTPLKMYTAGFSKVKHIKFLRLLGGGSNEDYYSELKWAPGHRTFILKESSETLSLVDSTGKAMTLVSGLQVGEPFWSADGSHLAFILGNDTKEVMLYNVLRHQAVKYPLKNGEFELVQWLDSWLWFYDDRMIRFHPISNEWESVKGWKDYWWAKPDVEVAHYRPDSLWQLGANIWSVNQDGRFKVMTYLPVNEQNGWRAVTNTHARWSPDDEQILFERQYKNTKGELKSEIWHMEKSGQNQQYLCEGATPEWLGNHQFLFLKDGDIHIGILGSGQIIRYMTPELTEQAFMVSHDHGAIAVIAKGQEEKVGLFIYELQ